MRITDFGAAYSRTVVTASIPAHAGSFAAGVGAEILAMARAYAEDGTAFLTSGNWVNAAAAFSYGLGWLDAGSTMGLTVHTPLTLPQLEEGDRERQGALIEKTARYHTLLDCALRALEVAPDPDTLYARAAEAFLAASRRAFVHGRTEEEEKNTLVALQQYSYAFGWLDAGVRAGLFRIREHREIFTV